LRRKDFILILNILANGDNEGIEIEGYIKKSKGPTLTSWVKVLSV
jgi:hypothetical protein